MTLAQGEGPVDTSWWFRADFGRQRPPTADFGLIWPPYGDAYDPAVTARGLTLLHQPPLRGGKPGCSPVLWPPSDVHRAARKYLL